MLTLNCLKTTAIINLKGCLLVSILFATNKFVYAQNTMDAARQETLNHIENTKHSIELLEIKKDNENKKLNLNKSIIADSNFTKTVQIDSLVKLISHKFENKNTELKYLRGLADLLSDYKLSYLKKEITSNEIHNVLIAYENSVNADNKHKDITPIIEAYKYGIVKLILNNYAFQNNSGKPKFANILIRKDLSANPSKSLTIINDLFLKNTPFPSIDSILHKFAKDSSDAIYTWAQSYGRNYPLGEYIRKSNDSLLKAINRIANYQGANGSKNGRQYMPFLDRLYHGTLTMDQIPDATKSPIAFYKLLIQTEIEYSNRAANKDTALGWETTKYWIKFIAIDKFINIVNGLHERANEVRYARLSSLSPAELYYLVVTSEDIIYTSTYVNGDKYGIYNMIWRKGGKDFNGDSLLLTVKFDFFKKWIKMAANFNTLDNFLDRMGSKNAKALIKAFVGNLGSKTGKDSLEDAVDVAGTFASIDQPGLKQLVIGEVERNLSVAKQNNNLRSFNIYSILKTLFLSMDPANDIDVSSILGIEPIYRMPIENLKDSLGTIVIQQTTYGDLDGRTNYTNFLDAVSRMGWHIKSNEYWSTASSVKGTKITVYTNKHLDELQHLDDDAQDELNGYLDDNNIHPTLMIHRGHSYYLKSTIDQMQPSEKVVFLGSCGGFQNLNMVLAKSPGAQIISTKQTGAGDLNLPIILGILRYLQNGKDLQWVKMWKEFSKSLSSDERFADYVPPYQNLGAVFLIAYDKLQTNISKTGMLNQDFAK